MDEGGVEIFAHTLEQQSEEVGISFAHALFGGSNLHMVYTRHLFYGLANGVAKDYRESARRLVSEEVCHLDMAAEADDLVLYGMLEAKHHAHRDYHHRQAYSHTSRCYSDGRLRHLLFSIL